MIETRRSDLRGATQAASRLWGKGVAGRRGCQRSKGISREGKKGTFYFFRGGDGGNPRPTAIRWRLTGRNLKVFLG